MYLPDVDEESVLLDDSLLESLLSLDSLLDELDELFLRFRPFAFFFLLFLSFLESESFLTDELLSNFESIDLFKFNAVTQKYLINFYL